MVNGRKTSGGVAGWMNGGGGSGGNRVSTRPGAERRVLGGRLCCSFGVRCRRFLLLECSVFGARGRRNILVRTGDRDADGGGRGCGCG